jgi:capsular polysaccharide biosynthesis protein
MEALRLGLWRQRYVFLAVLLLCLALGAAASLALPKRYEATATVYLDTSRNTPSFDLGLQSSELLAHDFIVLATKTPVLLGACAQPGVECSPQEKAHPDQFLARRVSVGVVKGTSLLDVTGTASSPSQAAAFTNAVATAMLEEDRVEIGRLFKPVLDSIDGQLSQYQRQIADEQAAIRNAEPGSGNLAAHQAALNALNTRYGALVAHRQEEVDRENQLMSIATLYDRAAPPNKPSAPDPVRYMLFALGAGLVLGGMAALLGRRLDDRIYDAETLGLATGMPVVSVSLRHGARAPFALVHAAVVARHPGARKILVTNVSPSQSAAVVSSGLGGAATEVGQRAIVIHTEGVVDHEVSHNGSGAEGLKELPEESAAVVTRMQSLAIPTNANPRGITEALTRYEGNYDVAYLSAPSPLTSPAGVWLAKEVDHVVLVGTTGVTRVVEAKQAAELLRQAGGNLEVSVLLAPEGRLEPK